MSENKWHVLYYQTKSGKSPVFEMIEKRVVREKAKILNWISLLEQHGPNLTRPYADLLKDGIHELRIKLSGDQIRILYFFCYRNYIILTNSFTKNTDKVPEEEIKKAHSCRLDFLERYTEKKLQEILENENI
jgi:hypothetical protein